MVEYVTHLIKHVMQNLKTFLGKKKKTENNRVGTFAGSRGLQVQGPNAFIFHLF